jgi:hypothetical protein
MHEHPVTAGKWVAILPGDRRASRRANMREEQMRMQMPAQISKVFV